MFVYQQNFHVLTFNCDTHLISSFWLFCFNNSSPLSLTIVSFSPHPAFGLWTTWIPMVFFPNQQKKAPFQPHSQKPRAGTWKRFLWKRKHIYTKHHFWTSRLVFKGNKNISPLSLWLANMASSLSTNYKGVILGACPNRLIYLPAILVVGFDPSEKCWSNSKFSQNRGENKTYLKPPPSILSVTFWPVNP